MPEHSSEETWDGPERRTTPRFSLPLAVVLDDAKGATRDISATGVFFTTQQALTVGAPITFELELPHADPRGVLRVGCGGTVLRIEPIDEAFGVAVHITAYGVDGQHGAVRSVSDHSGV
jgi:hypothetical protein